jgi:Fatty acid desaturase
MHNVPDYYLLSERISWRLTDFDFDAIDLENVSDDDREKIRETMLIENGIPHYTDLWGAIDGFSDEWELRQFNLIWSFEEFRHAESLRRVADKVGLAMDGEIETVKQTPFVKNRNDSCKCYATIGGMLTYTILQELVTWKFYTKWSKATSSSFLRRLLDEIAADEMRHHQWFANALPRYFARSTNPEAFRLEVVDAIGAFHMPHNFYALRFPFIEERMAEYFTEEDFNQMKSKVIKILAFDQEILMRVAAKASQTDLSATLGARRG